MVTIRKVNDRILAGIIAGVGGNIVKTTIEQIAFNRGYANNTGITKAAGFFMSPRKPRTPLGKLNGLIADNSVAAVLGICQSYIFTLTGSDYPTIKGLAAGDIAWTLAYGIMGSDLLGSFFPYEEVLRKPSTTR